MWPDEEEEEVSDDAERTWSAKEVEGSLPVRRADTAAPGSQVGQVVLLRRAAARAARASIFW